MSPTPTDVKRAQQLTKVNEAKLPVKGGPQQRKLQTGKSLSRDVNRQYSKPSQKDAPELKRARSDVGLSSTNSKKEDVNKRFSRPSPIEGGPDLKRTCSDVGPYVIIKSKSPLKRIGDFRLGPKMGNAPVKCIEQFLARKEGSDKFFILKVLTLKGPGEKQTTDDIQGKTLLHTEHSLLDIVKYEKGVVREHGLFRDTITEEYKNPEGKVITKEVNRICLALDCYMAHDFSPKYSSLTNMQQYVIKEKKLPEAEAIRIFYNVVQIVERLHKRNVVHRDLKLGNIILNKETREITLSNFCLGKHLPSENILLTDQRGSPAYISPDVISGKPYLGKPSDMWALGVVLYTMLYGQFPFYDQSPTELFRKIKLGEFQIPPNSDVNVSDKTKNIVKSLLALDPKERLTASQALEAARSVIDDEQSLMTDDDQVVPSFPCGGERPRRQNSTLATDTDDFDSKLADIAAVVILAKSILSESEETEPSRNHRNRNSESPGTLSIGKRSISLDEIERFHALYKAHKQREAASCSVKLPTTLASMVPGDLISSNALITSAATNSESARVPSSESKISSCALPNLNSDRSPPSSSYIIPENLEDLV